MSRAGAGEPLAAALADRRPLSAARAYGALRARDALLQAPDEDRTVSLLEQAAGRIADNEREEQHV